MPTRAPTPGRGDGELAPDLVVDLVAVRRHGRSHVRVHPVPPGPVGLHDRQGGADGAGRRAPPPGMDGTEHPRVGVDEGKGDAVGHHDHQGGARIHRHQDVGGGDRRLLADRATAAVGGADDGDPGAVDLAGEDQVLGTHPERTRGASSVDRDVLGPVTDVQAQVEGVVGRRRDAPGPGGDGNLDSERATRLPALQRDGGDVGHEPRPYRGPPGAPATTVEGLTRPGSRPIPWSAPPTGAGRTGPRCRPTEGGCSSANP